MELVVGIIVGMLLMVLLYQRFAANSAANSAAKPSRKRSSLMLLKPSDRSPSKTTTTTLFQSLRNDEEASQALQRRLLELVGGDEGKAEEWVAKARFADYGHSEDYYWWKAIQACQTAKDQGWGDG